MKSEWVPQGIDLNILKHILINNFFIKSMVKKKYGRILFFSSLAVEDTSAPITYSTAKAFLENYVKKSAVLFGKHNVFINCIKTSIIAAKNNNWYKATISKPDFVSELIKRKLTVERIGKPEDIIDFMHLIVASKNKFMNGSIVRIDGGLKQII